MSSWGDEIETAVHPGVWDALLSGDVDLLLQELLILLIDVLGNGLPAVDTAEEVGVREKDYLSEKKRRRRRRTLYHFQYVFWGTKGAPELKVQFYMVTSEKWFLVR